MRGGHVIEYSSYGGSEQLRFADQTKPTPKPNEVVVQVVAASVNHMDIYVREGRFKDILPMNFPAHEGTCFAGIVRGVGALVTNFKVGDEVLGHDPQHAAHATYVHVPAGAITKKPTIVSWETAASLYLAGLTALSTITDLQLDESDTIIISAAVGGVGHIECQLAVLAGATVIGIAGEENFDYLRSIGAKPVAYGPDIKERILKAAGGRRITKLIDNYGDYEDLAAELKVDQCKSSDDRRDLEVAYYLDNGKNAETLLHLRDLVELVENWHLRVLISGFYPFEYVVNALDDLDHRHSRGKVVLGMNTAAEPETYLLGKLRAYFEKTSAKVSSGRILVPAMNSQSDN